MACPGILDPIDNLLRHETAKTVHKYPAVSSEGEQGHNSTIVARTSLTRTSTTESSLRDYAQQTALTREVETNPDDSALGLFYSVYCLPDAHRFSADQLSDLGNGCLFAAARVLGMDAMNQTPRLACMQQYSTAINLLNAALRNPDEAETDGTLIATIIKVTIELKMSPHLAIDDFVNHINGATALLQLRGPEQVRSTLGAALYLQVSSQLYMSCVIGGRQVPDAFRQLRTAVSSYLDDSGSTCWREHGAVMRYVAFMALANTKMALPELGVEVARDLISEGESVHLPSYLFCPFVSQLGGMR